MRHRLTRTRLPASINSINVFNNVNVTSAVIKGVSERACMFNLFDHAFRRRIRLDIDWVVLFHR